MLQHIRLHPLRRYGHVSDGLLIFHQFVIIATEPILDVPHPPGVKAYLLDVVLIHHFDDRMDVPFLVKDLSWEDRYPPLFTPLAVVYTVSLLFHLLFRNAEQE